MDQAQFLTPKQLAPLLGKTPRTIRRWLDEEGCPRAGDSPLRAREDEVRAWCAEQGRHLKPAAEARSRRPSLAQAELARKLTIAKRNELDLAAERGLKNLGLADKIREAETHDDLLAYTKEVTALVSDGLLPVSRGNTLRSLVAQMGRTLTARLEQEVSADKHGFAMGSPEGVELMEAYEWIICPDRQQRVREYVQREAALDAEEYPNVDLTENPPQAEPGEVES